MTFARNRRAQRIAVLTLIPNRLASARAEIPAATAAATRSRKSPEYGAGTSSPNHMLPSASSPIGCGLQILFLLNPLDRKPLWRSGLERSPVFSSHHTLRELV